jgi:hypothetical protein
MAGICEEAAVAMYPRESDDWSFVVFVLLALLVLRLILVSAAAAEWLNIGFVPSAYISSQVWCMPIDAAERDISCFTYSI